MPMRRDVPAHDRDVSTLAGLVSTNEKDGRGARPDPMSCWLLFLRDSVGAQDRNRTSDTVIFSHVLYQLSYLGTEPCGSEEAKFYQGGGAESRAGA